MTGNFLSLWEYIINLTEVLLFVFFINSHLNLKNRNSHIALVRTLSLTFDFLVICLLNTISCPGQLTLLFTVVFDIFYTTLFFQDSLSVKLFWGMFFPAMSTMADLITVAIPVNVFYIPSEKLLVQGQLRLPFTLLYIGMLSFFILLTSLFHKNSIFFSRWQKFIFLVTSTSGIFICHYIIKLIIDLDDHYGDHAFTIGMSILCMFLILLFLLLEFYIYRIGISSHKLLELTRQTSQYNLDQQEYTNLLKSTEKLRVIKHDLQSHLNVIYSLALNDRTEELLDYVQKYGGEIEQSHQLLSTGNTAIDCILSDKLSVCALKRIRAEHSVILPFQFPLDSVYTVSLLGNLWNNAIEACEECFKTDSTFEPWIYFYIKPVEHMVQIHIENSYDGFLSRDEHGRILSRKKNHDNVGLKRINEIVSDANGICQINPSDRVFSVHILLPHSNTES